jgi:ubiquinone/menaquinone biosynthesis C-methylase UbiE
VSDAPDQYAGISEIYDAWCLEVQEDIGFYVGMARGTETPVVELAAGTGRIAIPLALSGYDVIAVDRSAAMLDLLRSKATAAGAAERIDVRFGELTAP